MHPQYLEPPNYYGRRSLPVQHCKAGFRIGCGRVYCKVLHVFITPVSSPFFGRVSNDDGCIVGPLCEGRVWRKERMACGRYLMAGRGQGMKRRADGV